MESLDYTLIAGLVLVYVCKQRQQDSLLVRHSRLIKSLKILQGANSFALRKSDHMFDDFVTVVPNFCFLQMVCEPRLISVLHPS